MDKIWIVYDSDTGKILSITNELENGMTEGYCETDVFTADEFAEGIKRVEDYIIVPDINDKTKGRLLNIQQESVDFDIGKNIFQVQKTNKPSKANFVIYQHKTHWTVHISEYLKNVVKDSDFYTNKVYNVYITDENDPNILLGNFKVKLLDLIIKDVEIFSIDKDVCERSDVNVYLYKEFDTYEHVEMI